MIRTHIMIHHSLTQDSGTVSWAAIEKYHRETQGWKDIGYHAGIELVTDNPALSAYKYQALLGRPEEDQAAACVEALMNLRALHVCCVGNFDLEPPSDTLLEVLASRVVRPWLRRHSIPPENIVGHHDYASYKSCPGTKFDLGRLRRLCR